MDLVNENLEQRLTRSQKKLIPNISGPGADKIGNTITELFNAFDEEGKEIELKKEEEYILKDAARKWQFNYNSST